MDNNKPIIEINDESITIDYGENNRKNYNFKISPQTYNALKRDPISLKKVALSVFSNLENPDLLDDETVLKIIDKILGKIRTSQYAKKLEEKRDEVERQILETKEIIKAPKEQGEPEPQENQSKGKTNEDFLNEWINEHNYSKCAKMLRAVEPEKKEQFLRELLKQEDGYEKCIMVLFSLKNYDSTDRENLKSELDKMIPEDIRTQISLEELCAKLSSAEDNLIKSLEMSEQEAHSEEIVEELDEEDVEEFIANLNLEELVALNPDPDAIRKGVEIEMHIEHDRTQTINEEQEEQQEENKENQQNEQDDNQYQQQENGESQQNEYDEEIDIEDNGDKDDSSEQLQSNANQLLEELDQLNKQILEIDEEIKKCDNAIQHYYTSSELETIRETIREIEDKIILRNLSDDEEKKLEQLKKYETTLIQKLERLRSNSDIPKFETKYDLKKNYISKALRKEELNPKSEELKTKKDEKERELAEIKRKIAEITEVMDEKDNQNFGRL